MQAFKKPFRLNIEAFLCLILAASVITLLYNSTLAKESKNIQSTDKEFSDKWEKEISKLGPEEAYEKFKKDIFQLNLGMQHRQAHIFGEELFKKSGINGIYVCDDSFSYGCYHSFLGSAIHEKGLNIISTLEKKCKEVLGGKWLACIHGIGHGVLAYLGYEYDSLIRSLETCDILSDRNSVRGCLDGVFMEYNFRTILAEESKARAYNTDISYEPCLNIPKKFRIGCYYQQPLWWMYVLEGTSLEKFQKIGSLCSRITSQDEKRQCFKGAGNNIRSLANWDSSQSLPLCEQFPSEEGILVCRAGAAFAFKTEALCYGRGDVFRDQCLKYSGLENKNR